MANRSTEMILEGIYRSVILDVRRQFLGEGNSSLALLGPGLTNGGEHVGFSAGYERVKMLDQYIQRRSD